MRKKFLIGLLTLSAAISINCGGKSDLAKLETMIAQENIHQQNKELVQRYVDTFNTRDLDKFQEFLSLDYAMHSPSGSTEWTRADRLIEGYKGVMASFPEFIWTVEDMIAEGDKVVCRISVKGRYKGASPELPQADTPIVFSMINIIRIAGGKIAEEWQEDDQLGMARQLGYELSLKQGGQ